MQPPQPPGDPPEMGFGSTSFWELHRTLGECYKLDIARYYAQGAHSTRTSGLCDVPEVPEVPVSGRTDLPCTSVFFASGLSALRALLP